MTGNAQQRPSQGGKVRDKSHEEANSTRTPKRESPPPTTRQRPDSQERRNADTESPPDE